MAIVGYQHLIFTIMILNCQQLLLVGIISQDFQCQPILVILKHFKPILLLIDANSQQLLLETICHMYEQNIAASKHQWPFIDNSRHPYQEQMIMATHRQFRSIKSINGPPAKSVNISQIWTYIDISSSSGEEQRSKFNNSHFNSI